MRPGLRSIGTVVAAARLAPDRPMGHALVLGGIGMLLATAGAVVMRDAGPAWHNLCA
jgi:hypothetical protein